MQSFGSKRRTVAWYFRHRVFVQVPSTPFGANTSVLYEMTYVLGGTVFKIDDESARRWFAMLDQVTVFEEEVNERSVCVVGSE